MATQDILNSVGLGSSSTGSIMTDILGILIAIVVLLILIAVVFFIIKKRKSWNIKVEFKLPRNIKQYEDGQIDGSISSEWGKGFYNSRDGVVYIKRRKKKPIPMKPFDVKKFLSPSGILTVIQVGVEDYRPVLQDGYLMVQEDEPLRNKKGELIKDKYGRYIYEEGALLKAKVDTTESKAWRIQFEREHKEAFSIKGFLQKHGDKLAMGLVILIVLVGQAIVIGRMN